MAYLQFAVTHLFEVFILAAMAIPFAVIAGQVITSPLRALATVNRDRCRAKNIAAHGWPPPHCDADGDGVVQEAAK